MVEADHRLNSHAHSAGLKRLSARAHAGAAPPSAGGRRVYFSFAAYARTAIEHLRNCRVPIEKGLSDEEFARVEAAYGFTFPPDLRAILHEGLPVGDGFPNWRHGTSQQLQMRFDLPTAGLLYEVARENVWWKQWGPRPMDTEQAMRVALLGMRKAPILVPLYSHCYLPSSPNLAGNPVYFVFLKDVFISGIDIVDFFQRDKCIPHEYQPPTNLPHILDWVDETGTRVMRMSSGRDLMRDRNRTAYGKENLIGLASRTGDDGNGAQVDLQQQQESVPACRLSDALAESAEEVEKKWDVLERDFESWGRNLDSLVAQHSEDLFKSLDNFGKQSNYCKGPDNNKRLQRNGTFRGLPVPDSTRKNPSHSSNSRFSYFEQCPLAAKTLLHFSMNAPPWAAKAARRIEFWGELTEKRPNANGPASFEPLFSARRVDTDVVSFSKDSELEDSSAMNAMTKFKSTLLPKWLASYLDDISLRLRKGGWKEDEIDDIMETSPRTVFPEMDRQTVLDDLARQAEILSSSLREAGWSIRDVAEVLHVDLSFGDHPRATSKLSPELAARISTFAEYVVNA